MKKINKVLVANRGEIAIRVFRACVELGIETVGIYTYEDRYSQHRYKADEAYQVGSDQDPLKPYLDIDQIIELAKAKQVDAIHPGYGFLSENSDFARACAKNNIVFIGPSPEVMDHLGNKEQAKLIAQKASVPIIESSQKALNTLQEAQKEATRIGFPVMLKAASGGGGRGMRVIRSVDDLQTAFSEAKREAENAFGDATVFLEKFIEDPKHIEVQILGDSHGNIIHLYERDCSVQRRYQKVIEQAPSIGLKDQTKQDLYNYALSIAKKVSYDNAGTVEFLVDKNEQIFFIEVNPRIQVEHTVTEMVTGVDLIKSQIMIAKGHKLSDNENTASQQAIKVNGYAIQCRVTTEDPSNNFKPDYGTITTYRAANGFGIRVDEGSIYQGAQISPFFDSMLLKISSHSSSLDGAIRKMTRALKEIRIRGVKTNIQFVSNIINHQVFKNGATRVSFIENYPEVFKVKKRQDRASKIVQYLGEVVINGNQDVRFVDEKAKFDVPNVPSFNAFESYPKGTKDLLNQLGPQDFSKWLKDEKKIHFTDTTMRDAHQSLLATRMRTIDMLNVAESYAKNNPNIFSLEVWGGATFDVALRFLHENPWARLAELRKAVPNILLQMLIRGSNAVGYTSYPDNLIERFIEQSHETGIDVFRIFDSLNWLKAMETSINTVRNKTGALAEVCLCYTGDILDTSKTKYTLDYYLKLAKDIENAGAHIIAIKDMAGLLKPYAAKLLIEALKDTVDLPIHLHTHDTSSLQTTTYLKAIEAGVDVVDVALGGLSGLTSQPNFNAVVEMLKYSERENKFDSKKLNEYSDYWQSVRTYYYPFESGLKSSTAQVFEHEIPGGQYSNLKPQAIALGLEDKFDLIKQRYKEVNDLFGGVIKVTPSSKVVGDMAQFMVSNDLTVEDVLSKGEEISFPDSVQAFFKGDLGQPYGGFPEKLQKIILKDIKPYTQRPNQHLKPVDFDKEYNEFIKEFQKGFVRPLNFSDFLSFKLYPKVWKQAYEKHAKYGDISKIPTKNFFYGMQLMEETIIEIAEGKKIIVKLLSVGPANQEGIRTVFFKVNGQTRNVQIKDNALKIDAAQNRKADVELKEQIGSPLQGLLSKILVNKGDVIEKNQPLFIIEAMKMETTITASQKAKVKKIVLSESTLVGADDLVLELDFNV